MLSIVASWMITVPVTDPWRPVIMVAEVAVSAILLCTLWDVALRLGGALRRANGRARRFEHAPVSEPN